VMIKGSNFTGTTTVKLDAEQYRRRHAR
jgi:hypothetical protein